MGRYTRGVALHQGLAGAGGPDRVGDDSEDCADASFFAPPAPGDRALQRRRSPVEPAGIGRRGGYSGGRPYPEHLGRLSAENLHDDDRHGRTGCGFRGAGPDTGGVVLDGAGEHACGGIDDSSDRRADHGHSPGDGRARDARARIYSDE